MNKILLVILLSIFLTNCSFDKKSGFWTEKKISKNNQIDIKKLFEEEKVSKKEFNPNLKININTRLVNNSFINNFDNNNGRINYEGNLKTISKFRFSNIRNISEYEPEISFNDKHIIFFDGKGFILKFDNSSKLIWKKNYYTKSEIKTNPVLFFANNKNILAIADSISKIYAININTGELLWSKKNFSPYNSEIKIYKDKLFAIDFDNVLRCYSLKDGNELWNVNTENSFIKSQKKLSLIIIDNKIYFNNSLGDITAVDIEKRQLIWQRPTQSNAFSQDSYSLKNSELIADNSNLYFSNNKNQFYSIELKTGTINWIQKINSSLKPTLIDDYLFTVSKEGFLLIIEKNSGNIIRSTDVLKKFNIKYLWEDKKLRDEITPAGFIVGKKNIYLTTDKGQLLLIDITTGSIKEILKIDKEKISRPFVQNQNLYIIKDNSVLKLN